MADFSAGSVCAIIVTFQPETAALLRLIEAITPQVGTVVVVDNASDGAWQQVVTRNFRNLVLLRQPCNVGLAVAQNTGIELARAKGHRHVMLLDQDSEPDDGMVATLLAALENLSTEHNVAAVGPQFRDLREARGAPFVRIGFPRNQKLRCGSDTPAIACDFLISSGTLIPLEVIDRVGAMDAGLFIDNVDLEWSFRARAQGYVLYGVCNATMHHRLGDSRRALPFGIGTIVVHGPTRLYYMMRNRLRLYVMPHTPGLWIVQDIPRVFVKMFLFGIMIGPRLRNSRFMLRGLCDGLRGRQGACPADLLR